MLLREGYDEIEDDFYFNCRRFAASLISYVIVVDFLIQIIIYL